MDPLQRRRDLGLYALPDAATQLLSALEAPPRLQAHLLLVHDVALRLIAALRRGWPALCLDETAISLGAALHDVGKALHPTELTEPGALHEEAGARLLHQHGFPVSVARIAHLHGQSGQAVGLAIEERLVMLADHLWKGARDHALEQRLAEEIAALTGQDRWDTLLRLDLVCERLAAAADERLLWQGQFAPR
jgi:putative nucleotidyltransferase with HDIG domain